MSDGTVNKEQRERFEFLLLEYEMVESKWRFLQGLRYVIFGGIVAGEGAFVTLYTNTLQALQTQPSQGLGKAALVIICIVALALIGTGVRLEQRLRTMYGKCSKRGAAIEVELNVSEGIFNVLERVPRARYINHTEAVQLFAILVTTAWVFLLFASLWLREGKL